MYRLEDLEGPRRRLVATQQLTRADFEKIAREVRIAPRTAHKVGYVAARTAEGRKTIETMWNGRETIATADPGDWIATNLDSQQTVLRDESGSANIYVIKRERFPELYEWSAAGNEHGDIFRARTTVRAVPLSGGFDILAPWGENQKADAGYLIENGDDIYGNAKETFDRTYVFVDVSIWHWLSGCIRNLAAAAKSIFSATPR